MAALRDCIRVLGLDAVRVIVTSYGAVRLSNEAIGELNDLCGVHWLHPDKRTKKAKLAQQIYNEIEHLAMLEWINGGELTEL